MQHVSESEKALIDSYAKITLAIYIDGVRLTAGIGGCEYAHSCGDDEAFSFGNACAASLTVPIDASRPDLKGHRIKVTWAVSETEHPLLTGKVENAKVSAGQTTIEAWDDMYYGGSDAFVPTSAMQSDIDAAEAFSALAGFMGVTAEVETLDMLSGITIRGGLGGAGDEVSNSAVAGYIAGLVGGNAIMTRGGLLAIRLYTPTGWSTEPYSGGASAENEDFRITGVTLQREEMVTVTNTDGTTGEEEQLTEYSAGDGTLMVANPFADQEAAERAYAALQSVVIRPGSYSFPGGILLDPGDMFFVESMDGTYCVAAVLINMGFDGGVKTDVSCGGPTADGGAAGAVNQALKTLMADFAKLRSLVAENAAIVSAKITNLSVEDIVAGRIRSTDFATVTLPEIYPAIDLFPSDTLCPNNGEQIIRGFEIDFASGIIRGAFFNPVTDALIDRCDKLEARIEALERALVYS